MRAHEGGALHGAVPRVRPTGVEARLGVWSNAASGAPEEVAPPFGAREWRQTMKRVPRLVFFAIPAMIALGLPLLVGAVRAGQRGDTRAEQPPARPANERPSMATIGQQLVEGLRATPGCLGTELAQTASGKSVIFGWFEGKKAAVAWYESPTHQKLMDRFFPDRPKGHAPMEGVPDDVGPIMAIASITITPEGPSAVPGAPISQIAIELYTPLHAGFTLNGSFAPESMKVEGRRDVRASAPDPAGGRPEGGSGR